MKTIIIVALLSVACMVVGLPAKEPTVTLVDTHVDLAKPFPYNVATLEGCLYITYRVSPTQRGLTHAGSCKNPVHSIYGRIASHEG